MKKITITCDYCEKELDINTCIHVEVKATIPAKQYVGEAVKEVTWVDIPTIQSFFIPEHDDTKSIDFCESCYNDWKDNHL